MLVHWYNNGNRKISSVVQRTVQTGIAQSQGETLRIISSTLYLPFTVLYVTSANTVRVEKSELENADAVAEHTYGNLQKYFTLSFYFSVPFLQQCKKTGKLK